MGAMMVLTAGRVTAACVTAIYAQVLGFIDYLVKLAYRVGVFDDDDDDDDGDAWHRRPAF
jgi:hypothetical protein